MSLEKAETMTDRVEGELEKQILSGKYQPNTRLVGIRQLSDEFNVSRIVVRTAIDRLERKSLVVKMPSKGVYVSDRIFSLRKYELFVLSYIALSSSLRSPSFIENAMNLNRDFSYRKRFNLTMRCIGWDTLNVETFRHEVAKANSLHAQVILLGSSYIDREKIEVLNRCGVPYLIVGELHHQSADLKFNHIYARYAAKVEEIAAFLARSGYRKIAYFSYIPGQFDYENEIRSILDNRLQAAGKELMIEYLPSDLHTEPDNTELQLHGLRRMLERGDRPDLLYIIRNVDLRQLIDLLAEYGLRIGENIQILCIRHLCEGDKFPEVMSLELDYSEFAQSVFDQLAEIVENPGEIVRRDLSGQVRQRITGGGIDELL